VTNKSFSLNYCFNSENVLCNLTGGMTENAAGEETLSSYILNFKHQQRRKNFSIPVGSF